MSLIRFIMFITLVCLQTVSLHAEDFYYGFKIGYGSLNENAPSTDTASVASGITAPEGLSLVGEPVVNFDYSIDDKDINWKIFGGYNFSRFLSVETGYMNFGKSIVSTDLSAEITTTLPDPMTGTQTSSALLHSRSSIKTHGFFLNGVARYPFMDKFNTLIFSVYSELGIIVWDTNINTRQTLDPFSLQTPDPDAIDTSTRSGRFSSGDKGVNFLLGVGADYQITNDIGIRAGWSYYRGIYHRNINHFSIGAFYQFSL